MGQPMAQNVVKGGFALTVYNRSSEKAKPFGDAGATVASTPKAVAEASDVIILMLAGPEAIDAVLEGSEGLMAGLQAGQTLVNMSTVSPQYSKQLAGKLTAKSAVAIDAPVSGSRKPADPQDKVTELEPLLMCMGKKVVYCGDAGQGASMKMAVNLLLGIMAAGISEAVNLGQKSGLDTATMLETMLAGPMGCALFEFKKPMLIDDSFSAQFPLKHMTKDIRFALQTADENGAMAPIGHTVFQLYRQSMGQGLADQDFAAVKKVYNSNSDALGSGAR
jgi:3-hydroxyisobutyrate dehydrogenase-like beta-hydroxyacid dehydrogenase